MTEHEVLHRVDLDGVEVEYSDQGDGKAVLLVHAGVFGAWFAPLVRDGMLEGRVIRMLRAGYTSGSRPATHLSIYDHARHCAALLDRLDLYEVDVVAHSSGCLIALQLAVDRPAAVRSLVLLEPSLGGDLTPPSFGEIGQRVIGPAMAAAAAGDTASAFDIFMSGICAPDYRSVMEAALGRESLARAERDAQFFFADEISAVNQWTFTPVEAARVSQPLLLLLGGGSPVAVHEIGARLAALVPSTEAGIVPAADHLLPLRDPITLAQLVSAFLKREREAEPGPVVELAERSRP
jgi:pimeloyl-ACP methyl ester carboxylesterase